MIGDFRISRWLGHALWTAISIVALVRCGPYEGDDDSKCGAKAKPLPSAGTIQDELNVRRGDSADCKQFKPYKDFIAHIEYHIGTPFERHNLKGKITVLDEDAHVLEEKPVDPTVAKYDFAIPVKEKKLYYVTIEATEGNYAYTVSLSYEKIDPCKKCKSNQRCEDGECITIVKVKTCNPPCDDDEGLICEDGRCVNACNPECRKGYACNVAEKRCEKMTKDCKPRCKKDQYCDRRNGKCRTKAGPKKCPVGQVRSGGKCITLGRKCPECPDGQTCSAATGYVCKKAGGPVVDANGPITGSITNQAAVGAGTTIYINRGTQHGVKVGQRGKACGKSFVIIKAFPTRSQGKTGATPQELAACKAVMISR